jgi:hypothetical protein
VRPGASAVGPAFTGTGASTADGASVDILPTAIEYSGRQNTDLYRTNFRWGNKDVGQNYVSGWFDSSTAWLTSLNTNRNNNGDGFNGDFWQIDLTNRTEWTLVGLRIRGRNRNSEHVTRFKVAWSHADDGMSWQWVDDGAEFVGNDAKNMYTVSSCY